MAFTNPEKRIPAWFVRILQDVYAKGTFTTEGAVELYLKWRTPRMSPVRIEAGDDVWCRMNARNALSCMVQVGLIERLERGLYRFKERKDG